MLSIGASDLLFLVDPFLLLFDINLMLFDRLIIKVDFLKTRTTKECSQYFLKKILINQFQKLTKKKNKKRINL